MVNEEFQKIIIELSDIMEKDILCYFAARYQNDDEESSVILNLVLSAHLSSLANIMKAIARDTPGVQAAVDHFLKELLEFISKRHRLEFYKTHSEH